MQNLIKEFLFHHRHHHLVEFPPIRSNRKLLIKAYSAFVEVNYT